MPRARCFPITKEASLTNRQSHSNHLLPGGSALLLTEEFNCCCARWETNQPPVLLHIMLLGHLSVTSTLASIATGPSISHQYSCKYCQWAIYQPPVLSQVLPLGHLSTTILSVLSFPLLHKISAATPSLNRTIF